MFYRKFLFFGFLFLLPLFSIAEEEFSYDLGAVKFKKNPLQSGSTAPNDGAISNDEEHVYQINFTSNPYKQKKRAISSSDESASEQVESPIAEVEDSEFTNWKPKAKPPSAETSLLNSYGLYSPHVKTISGQKRLWVGGWVSSADPFEGYLQLLDNGVNPAEIYGPDKIYTGLLTDSADQNANNLKLSLALKGYHVNDPTIIAPPSDAGQDRSTWLYMYFTMLSNQVAEKCRKSNQTTEHCPDLFEKHDIGFASSIDGGVSWTYRGIVVTAADSGDGKGAWTPSAIVVENEIWLYYSSGRQDFNQENLFRLKLHANGHQKLDAPQAVDISAFKAGKLYANAEVVQYENKGRKRFLMVANDGPQKNISLHESADGLNFKTKEEKLITGNAVVSPFIEQAFMNEVSSHGGTTSVSAFSAPLFLRIYYAERVSAESWKLRKTELNFDLK
ncbi:MAG: glycoside hydrolase [Oligoflexia bacterium]|nr:glycoside hydrolase [Oligoflexia bacterium]